MEDRRLIKRFDLELPMVIKGKDAAGKTFVSKTHSLNISSKGVYFLTRECVRLDCKLHVTLYLSSTTVQPNKLQGKKRNEAEVKGTVVRIDRNNCNTTEKGVALRFDQRSNWGM